MAAQAVSAAEPDAVVLTGGVAEHQPGLRAELFDGALLGARVDPARNRATGDRLISAESSRTAVVLVTCREENELARLCEETLSVGPTGAPAPS